MLMVVVPARFNEPAAAPPLRNPRLLVVRRRAGRVAAELGRSRVRVRRRLLRRRAFGPPAQNMYSSAAELCTAPAAAARAAAAVAA